MPVEKFEQAATIRKGFAILIALLVHFLLLFAFLFSGQNEAMKPAKSKTSVESKMKKPMVP